MANWEFLLSHLRLREHVNETCCAQLRHEFPESGVGKQWCQYPPLTKNTLQPQDVAIFLRDIDGSHIPCAPPPTECTMYHNHKGFLSQNCLFACSFNLKFIFGYTGWEGSAMDNQVWEVALECRLNIPGSHYFLADAGYADDPQLLLPYCDIWYHLAEWNQASQKVGHCSTSGTQYCPFLQATKQGGIV